MSAKNALYQINTRMDKADYRKFSYLTIFKKKYKTLFLILLLAAVVAGFASIMDTVFEILEFLLIWVCLIATAYAAIFAKVEYKAFQWASQVQIGIAGGKQTISFFENYLVAEQENIDRYNKIKYDALYQVLETEDYYFIYANARSASILRKKDIEEEDRDGFHRFLKAKLGDRYHIHGDQ